jgi:hypothetical protein
MTLTLDQYDGCAFCIGLHYVRWRPLYKLGFRLPSLRRQAESGSSSKIKPKFAFHLVVDMTMQDLNLAEKSRNSRRKNDFGISTLNPE